MIDMGLLFALFIMDICLLSIKKEHEIMETKNMKKMKKTQVFNVIILDRSGSMDSIRKAAVDGFNETLAGIKKAQADFADTQDHFVSLVTFCSCSTEKVFDKTPVNEAHPLKLDDYQPCCCTPLFDAMGFTLTSMRKHVKGIEDALVVVTIITDGLENASKEYSGKAIRNLVEQLKGEGWTFTYMGANQDAVEVAISLSIRNARNFDFSEAGTRDCMSKDMSTRMRLFSFVSKMKKEEGVSHACITREDRNTRYADMADAAFDAEENNG